MSSPSHVPPRPGGETSERPAAPAGAVPSDSGPAAGRGATRYLEPVDGSVLAPQQYPLPDQLEIGRLEDGRQPTPGLLLLPCSRVSWRHCIIRQGPDGACYVRDVSRNGTRLDGRRLVPNMETEMHLGQVLDVGPGMQFRLGGQEATGDPEESANRKATDVAPHLTYATVVVGDIRNYTVMVRKADPEALQQSVSCVFELLTAAIEERGGTVKEFPGDAVFAFWEGSFRGEHALAACRAVVELDRLSQQLASNRSVWAVPGHPLELDWALATGSVSIDSFGGATPMGLSIVGEPVVKASRLEKFADDRTGRILLSEETYTILSRGHRRRTQQSFEFIDLGERQAKGFDVPDRVFALRVDAPDS